MIYSINSNNRSGARVHRDATCASAGHAWRGALRSPLSARSLAADGIINDVKFVPLSVVGDWKTYVYFIM